MLLVGHHQAQPPEGHRSGQQSVGPHHEVDLPRLQGGIDPLFFSGPHTAGEQSHPHPGRGEQRRQGAAVLLGQDLSGGHHGRLPAAAEGHPGTGRGHRRLARAHVPLEQPVHGPSRGQIGGALGDGPPLGLRGRKGQQSIKVRRVAGRKGWPLPPAAALAQQGQAGGQGEELLKHQPPFGPGQGVKVLGKVDTAAGELRRGQVMGLQ